MQLEFTAQTDIGNVRENNEDAYYIDGEKGVMIISDGMGGQDSGEIASSIVIKMLPTQIAVGKSSGKFNDVDMASNYLIQALRILSETVLKKSIEFEQSRGMGATVVACVLLDESLIIAHLGDSRAYLLRDCVFERLTSDHNMAELLLENKLITRDEFPNHPGQHMLRRFVGMKDCPYADVGVLDILKGDRILLCSDGLTGKLKDEMIGQLILEQRDAKLACQGLINLALDAGGDDNITVVIADVPSEDDLKEKHNQVKVIQEVGITLRPKKKKSKISNTEIIL